MITSHDLSYDTIATMKIDSKYILYLAFGQALIATLGSLYASEVLHWTPCVLCWYQRIFMYPLVIILAVGIIKQDRWLPWYVLCLAGIGWLVSLYHNLLYFHILPESVAPCTAHASCTTWHGWFTLPQMAFTGFSVILICMILAIRYNR